MKIQTLGTRGNVDKTAPYHPKHSGIFIDDRILFDLGEKEYLQLDPQCIFITHLHPDHAFFVTAETEKIDVSMYAPETFEKMSGVRKISKTVEIETYRVTPIPTHHSKRVDSAAYLTEKESQRILYTGDIIWINKEYHQKLKDLDLVITDGSFIRDKGLIRKDKDTGQLYGHNGIPNLVNLFKNFTEHILFTHFGN